MANWARRLLGCLAASATLLGCSVSVATGLDDADANHVVTTLDGAGIAASKESDPTTEGRFRVMVSRDDSAHALAALADEQLPRAKPRGLLETTQQGSIVPSASTEHAQIVIGLSGELERTLSSIDGVLSARVHLNLPPRDPFGAGLSPRASASVLVEHKTTNSPISTEAIQKLVAGGAGGLSPSDVAVVTIEKKPKAATSAEFRRVGPISVARGSASMLRGLLAALGVLLVAFASATVWLGTKLARLRRDSHGSHVPGAHALTPR